MEQNEKTNPSEENFIPGIFNYCDRWCERCLYTNRCRTFAMEKELREISLTEEREKKSREENKQFWNQIDQALSEASEIYDDLLPKEKKNTLSEIHFLFDEDEKEDAEEAMKDFEDIHKKVENQPLSKTAFRYEAAVRKWFEERKDLLKINFNSPEKESKVKYQDIDDPQLLNTLSESVDIILWYKIQIGIKIQRALASFFEEDTEGDFLEDFPKDSDGSAMVALKGINRSLGAWNQLFKILKSEKEHIAPFIVLLFLLRAELIKLFPGALIFCWPPEEETDE